MILAIRQFFEKHLDSPQPDGSEEAGQRLRLASAALLIEMARADYETRDSEMRRITAAVSTTFGLDAEATKQLLELADAQARSATSLHGFTSLINEHWPLESKIKLIELMWQVAYADAEIDKHEHHLMRKMVRLLYVPHSDYIAAKMRAKAAVLGGE